MPSMETEVELRRVKLIPIKSSWTCPTCFVQNVVGAHEHADGKEAPPSKGSCSNCKTVVILGIPRATDSAATTPSPLTEEQVKDVAERAGMKIQSLAIERCEAWGAIAVKEMTEIVASELMAVATVPSVSENAVEMAQQFCSDWNLPDSAKTRLAVILHRYAAPSTPSSSNGISGDELDGIEQSLAEHGRLEPHQANRLIQAIRIPCSPSSSAEIARRIAEKHYGVVAARGVMPKIDELADTIAAELVATPERNDGLLASLIQTLQDRKDYLDKKHGL